MRPYIVTICSQSFETGIEVCLERNVLSDLSPKLLYAHFLLKNGVHRCFIGASIEGQSFDDPLVVEESSFNSDFKSVKGDLKKAIIKRDKDESRLEDANFLTKAPKEVVEKVTSSYTSLSEEVDALTERSRKVELLILRDVEDSFNLINEGLMAINQLLDVYSPD